MMYNAIFNLLLTSVCNTSPSPSRQESGSMVAVRWDAGDENRLPDWFEDAYISCTPDG